MPLFVILLLHATAIPQRSAILANVSLILMLAVSSSQAAIISQLAQVFQKDEREAALLNVMTVLFLVVTMPLNVWFLIFPPNTPLPCPALTPEPLIPKLSPLT